MIRKKLKAEKLRYSDRVSSKRFLFAPDTSKEVFGDVQLFVSVDGCHAPHGSLKSIYAITAKQT